MRLVPKSVKLQFDNVGGPHLAPKPASAEKSPQVAIYAVPNAPFQRIGLRQHALAGRGAPDPLRRQILVPMIPEWFGR
jgi:hypothetical protein